MNIYTAPDPSLTKAQQAVQELMIKHQRAHWPSVIKHIHRAKSTKGQSKAESPGPGLGPSSSMSLLDQQLLSNRDILANNNESSYINNYHSPLGSSSSSTSLGWGIGSSDSNDLSDIPIIPNKDTSGAGSGFSAAAAQQMNQMHLYLPTPNQKVSIVPTSSNSTSISERKKIAMIVNDTDLDIAVDPLNEATKPAIAKKGRPPMDSEAKKKIQTEKQNKREVEAIRNANLKFDKLIQAKSDSDYQTEVAGIAQEELKRASQVLSVAESILEEKEKTQTQEQEKAYALGTKGSNSSSSSSSISETLTKDLETLANMVKQAQQNKTDKETAASKHIKIACSAQDLYTTTKTDIMLETEVNHIMRRVMLLRKEFHSDGRLFENATTAEKDADLAKSLISLGGGPLQSQLRLSQKQTSDQTSLISMEGDETGDHTDASGSAKNVRKRQRSSADSDSDTFDTTTSDGITSGILPTGKRTYKKGRKPGSKNVGKYGTAAASKSASAIEKHSGAFLKSVESMQKARPEGRRVARPPAKYRQDDAPDYGLSSSSQRMTSTSSLSNKRDYGDVEGDGDIDTNADVDKNADDTRRRSLPNASHEAAPRAWQFKSARTPSADVDPTYTSLSQSQTNQSSTTLRSRSRKDSPPSSSSSSSFSRSRKPVIDESVNSEIRLGTSAEYARTLNNAVSNIDTTNSQSIQDALAMLERMQDKRNRRIQ